MKKSIKIMLIVLILIVGIFSFTNLSYAAVQENEIQTESKLIELKESASKTLEDYKEDYGSDIYGMVAYILGLVRIYSIPLCFLGIVIGAIHQYVIGIRKMDTLEKGTVLMVTFTTILIICQILPLAFLIFVKFGKE